jgi:hypothetical protein
VLRHRDVYEKYLFIKFTVSFSFPSGIVNISLGPLIRVVLKPKDHLLLVIDKRFPPSSRLFLKHPHFVVRFQSLSPLPNPLIRICTKCTKGIMQLLHLFYFNLYCSSSSFLLILQLSVLRHRHVYEKYLFIKFTVSFSFPSGIVNISLGPLVFS